MGNWEEDLDYGERAEETLIASLSLDVKERGKDYKWDILEKDGTTHEVKCDRRAPETGNHYVETSWNGYRSGINTTEAQYWHCVVPWEEAPWEIITVKRDVLRKAIEDESFGRRTGGDNMKGKGVLIPLDDLRKLAT